MWALDRALATRAARRDRHDEIDKALAHAFADQPRDEIVARLLAAGVTCAPVWESAEIDSLPEIVEADFFTTLEHPTVGPVTYPGTGLRSPDFSLDPTGPRRWSASTRPPCSRNCWGWRRTTGHAWRPRASSARPRVPS